MKTLKDAGFRFIKRGTEYKWCHPAEMLETDTDCTDMSDDKFEAFVLGAG